VKSFAKIHKKIKAPTFSENIENIDSSKQYRSYFFGSKSIENDSIAISFKIFHEENLIYEKTEAVGRGTGNEARYLSLLLLLEFANTNKIENLEIFGNSKLIIDQVLSAKKTHAENLKPFHSKVTSIFAKNQNFKIIKLFKKEQNEARFLAKNFPIAKKHDKSTRVYTEIESNLAFALKGFKD
ncbi:hypothetical protein ThvES_00009320, partial [Thiovulum sp. ES]